MGRKNAGAMAVLVLLFLVPFSGISNAEDNGSCCEQDGFKMFLTGEAQSGGLTPFSSNLDQRYSAVVTPSVLGAIEIGSGVQCGPWTMIILLLNGRLRYLMR